jgi:hypothetical protein
MDTDHFQVTRIPVNLQTSAGELAARLSSMQSFVYAAQELLSIADFSPARWKSSATKVYIDAICFPECSKYFSG